MEGFGEFDIKKQIRRENLRLIIKFLLMGIAAFWIN